MGQGDQLGDSTGSLIEERVPDSHSGWKWAWRRINKDSRLMDELNKDAVIKIDKHEKKEHVRMFNSSNNLLRAPDE